MQKNSGSLLFKLDNVSQSFGVHKILSHVDLEIHGGQIVALLGDNGAGKSTLIKIISGFHRLTEGHIYWEGKRLGRDYSPKAARRLGIQTVFQHLGLVDSMSIARNFFLGQEPCRGFTGKLDLAHMRKTVAAELAKIGLARKLDADIPVGRLSGGERQAVAICRARYWGAKLLILDEPTSALSVGQTAEVLSYIRKAKELGTAIILITHTLQHAAEVADKVVILFKGQIAGSGSVGELSESRCRSLMTTGRLPA